MICSQCGTQYEGNFCPCCGTASQNNSNNKKKTIKVKSPFYKKWWFWVIICFLALILFVKVDNNDDIEEFIWSDIELSGSLPQPTSNIGEIIYSSDSSLDIYIHEVTKTGYKEYLSQCKSLGYIVDKDESEDYYSAYNNSGYDLYLMFDDEDGVLHISLDVPEEMFEIRWPNSKVGQMLPVPESNIGYIEWEADYGFVINIGNTTKSDYDNYVNACMDMGFTVEYSKGSDYFWADNEEGYHISVSYSGNNIMNIRADEPDESSLENEKKDKEENVDYIENFISRFNELSDVPITERVSFNPQDKNSGYYRHEYRLNDWNDSIGIAGKIKESIIEITNYGYYKKSQLRIHLTTIEIDVMIEIIPALLTAVDSSVTEEEIQEVQKEIKETHFYQEFWGDIGDIRSISFGDHDNYFSLMVDIDYDPLLG